MKTKRHEATVVVALAAGLVGGVISGRWWGPKPAQAGDMSMAPKPMARHDRTIRAEQFQLVDRNGKVRANLEVVPTGGSRLVFYGRKGSPAMVFNLDPKGNAFMRFAGKGGSNMIMGIRADDCPGLAMHDKRGKIRCILRLDSSGDPVMVLQDEKGISRVVVGKISSEVTRGAEMTKPISSMTLFDGNEKVIWQAPP